MSNRKLRKIDKALLPRIEELLRQGISVRKMAEDWDVPETTIYYWCRTFSLNVIKLKQEGRVQLGGRKKYTYHYYLNQEFKQGRITPRQKKQYLTKFYMHKGGFTLDTADVVQSESNENNVETVS